MTVQAMADDTASLSPAKNLAVQAATWILGLSLAVFLATGAATLYWAWLRADLHSALPYVPWARNSGALAMALAALILGVLFLPRRFPLTARRRLWLSLLATCAIGFFAEFRNEGKFHLRKLVHFFGPGTWIHDALNRLPGSLGDTFYRLEYSHWNDFLMGPAIVSVLFAFTFLKIYAAAHNQASLNLSTAPSTKSSTDVDHALRFARTLMNVGLFWFFIDAWAEKAGYLSNPHSSDEVDLPFEFAGTMLGFWMVRALTRPFDKPSEKFRSTLLIDFVASGVMGLLYTLIVGVLTEGVASAVGHALYPVVPGSLDQHEYTSIQRHMRPLELLLLAGALWWSLNRVLPRGAAAELSDSGNWTLIRGLTVALAGVSGYLLLVLTMLSILQPDGPVWTLATAGSGLAVGAIAYLLIRRLARTGLFTLLSPTDRSKQ